MTTLDDGSVAVFDKNSTYRVLNAQTLEVVDGYKTKLTHQHRTYNIMSVCKSGKYTLIGKPDTGKAALYSNSKKSLLAQIGMHKGALESVTISDDERYFATAGTDGRTFIYEFRTGNILLSMPPHADYVSVVRFSANSKLVATASFDRTIRVKNIAMMSDAFNLTSHTAPIKQMEFISSELLVSADKEGHILLWDLFAKKVKKRLPKMLEEINDIALTSDKRFLFVATKLGNIGLYDLEQMTQLSRNYIKNHSSITSLTIVEEHALLCYGTHEGHVYNYLLTQGDEELAGYLQQKEFAKAYKLIETNAMLRFSSHYEKLEQMWETSLSQAKVYLERDQVAQAKALLEPFAQVAKKQTTVKSVLTDFKEFNKLKEHIASKKYNLAYSLIAQKPIFKQTKEYENLEHIWETQLAKAKKDIWTKAGDDKARAHLAAFRGVSHKAKFITELFNQRNAYMFFRKKLSQRDYFGIFQIVKQHPFLEQMNEYKAILRLGDSIYIKINHHYEEHEYMQAIKLAELIKDFPMYKDEVKSLTSHAQIYIDFEQAINSEDIDAIYKMLHKYTFLNDLPIVDRLDETWYPIEDEAYSYAAKGNVAGVMNVLKSFIAVKYRYNKIVAILKTAYVKQIRQAMKNRKDAHEVKTAILKMYELFCEDAMIDALVDLYSDVYKTPIKKENITLRSRPAINLDNVNNSIFES